MHTLQDELIELFGAKPEDAYIRAKNRVMTGKPSQFGKLLIEDICTCPTKLASGCCAKIIWGMYRDGIPVIIRNHIAQLDFNKNTYKQIFKISDQVFDSNRQDQPARGGSVAAVTTATTSNANQDSEVAAIRPPRKNKNQNQRNNGASNGGGSKNQNSSKPNTGGQSSQSNATQASQGNKGPRHATDRGENDKLCKIHYRWGENGTYCAAPWKCPMKNVYKAPQ